MNDEFEKKLQALSAQSFEAQLGELNDDVLIRLRQSRQRAISSIQLKEKRIDVYFPAWLSPISTATALASVALISSSLWFQPDTKESGTTSFDDVALLSSADELDFFENLDFYIWLESETNTRIENQSNTNKKDGKSAG